MTQIILITDKEVLTAVSWSTATTDIGQCFIVQCKYITENILLSFLHIQGSKSTEFLTNYEREEGNWCY